MFSYDNPNLQADENTQTIQKLVNTINCFPKTDLDLHIFPLTESVSFHPI